MADSPPRESLTGRENEPASAEATGLEVDKLNRGYVKNYLDHYLKTYKDTVGPAKMGPAGITFVVTDSVKVGAQNWTDDMLDEFDRRRGYSAVSRLPALTGVVIDSTAETNRFLWDFRRTIAQLFAENHYGTISDELHKRGLRYYGETLEFRRPSLCDEMEVRSRTDIPMAAMWAFAEKDGPNPTYVADDRSRSPSTHLRSEPGRGGVDDRQPARLDLVAQHPQAHRLHGVCRWHQPFRDPRIDVPAAGRAEDRTRTHARHLWPVVHPQRDLG